MTLRARASGIWALGLLTAASAWILLRLQDDGGAHGAQDAARPVAGESCAHGGVALELPPSDPGRVLVVAGLAGGGPGEPPAGVLASAPPAEAGEKKHHAYFLALGRRDPSALLDEAPAILQGTGPDCRKVALLRALHASAWPAAAEAFALVLSGLPDVSRPGALSVPAFALDFLGQRAQDATARAVLREAVWGERRVASEPLRRRAAASHARWASPAELQELAPQLAMEDPLLRAGVAAALAENPEQRAVDILFADLPVPRGPPALEGDQPPE
jgi:hypothetical protein